MLSVKTILYVAAALMIAALPLRAQVVRGELVEASTGAPIDGARVILLDAAGAQHGGALTDPGGRYGIRAPAPGRYRLRAERVGYRSTTSEVLELHAGEVREHTLRAPTEAISIEGITVRGRQRCQVRPREGLATARVWEEARKALSASAWAQRERGFRYEARAYTRELEPRHLRVVREEVQKRSGYGTSSPYVSRPAEELAERGFVWASEDGRYLDYYAPDAEVLLSDAFLDTHCFRLAAGKGEQAGLVGLAFESISGRHVPEVRGTLWLDRKSAELRHLEFQYAGRGGEIPLDHAGGRIEFERLPSGVWIVRRWWIRMPEVGTGRTRLSGSTLAQRRILRFREKGAEVVRVFGEGGEWLDAPERAVLLGMVHDSTRSAQLAGAQVFLSGTQHRSTTDETGRFRLTDLPSGRYAVTFLHPRLDSLGVVARPVEVRLDATRPTFVQLAVPATAAVVAAGCPGTIGSRTGVITGMVREAATGARLSRAKVFVKWIRPTMVDERTGGNVVIAQKGRTLEIETDERGHYRICDVPAETPISLWAEVSGLTSEPLTAKLYERELKTVDIPIRVPPES